VETKVEYSDLKLISRLFEYLKEKANDLVHVFLLSGDKDFLLLISHLKNHQNVRTHLMTSFHHVAFAKGLADMVVSYPRLFAQMRTPSNSPRKQNKRSKKNEDSTVPENPKGPKKQQI
jgi:hypothetical protein